MSVGSRICPHCGALNAVDERHCHRCSRSLPGPLRMAAGDLVATGLGFEFPVTKLLIGLCVVVFLLSVLGKANFPIGPADFVLRSESLRWGGLLLPIAGQEPWRYLSAVFVHGNALHLLLNMLALLSLGRGAERELGSPRFTVAFVLSGIGGYLVSHAWFSLWPLRAALLVGASGAIFGLLGVEIGVMVARRAWEARSRLWQALALVVVIGLLMPVNNSAHLGGLLVGIAVGYGFGLERGVAGRNRVFTWIAGLLLLGCVASVLASTRSPVWRAVREYEIANDLV